MKNKLQNIIFLLGLCIIFISLSGCKKNQTGVCTGYSSDYNTTYCKDGWTKEECEEWNALKVNDVDWYFHKGQTCAERGTPATL